MDRSPRHGLVRGLCVLAGLGLLADAAAAESPPARVVWAEGGLAEALLRAKAERRWLVVDVMAAWCGPCQAMDEQVYSREDVARELGRGWIALRRDGESGEGAEIAARYHVVGFPTLLVLAPDGKEVDRLMGFVDAPALLAQLAAFRAGRDTLAALERRAGARSPAMTAPDLLLELLRRHALRGDPRTPAEAAAVVARDPRNLGGRAGEALLLLGKYYYLRGTREYGAAEATLTRLATEFPDAKQSAEAPYHLAIARHQLGDDARAQRTLDDWLATGPRDAEQYNGFAWCCFKNRFARARAITVAREGLARFPTADALWDTLGELLAADGQRAEAQAAARKALSLKPADRYYASQLAKHEGKP